MGTMGAGRDTPPILILVRTNPRGEEGRDPKPLGTAGTPTHKPHQGRGSPELPGDGDGGDPPTQQGAHRQTPPAQGHPRGQGGDKGHRHCVPLTSTLPLMHWASGSHSKTSLKRANICAVYLAFTSPSKP